MPTNTFRGDAPYVAQVSVAVITGYDAATTYSVTINGRSISTVGTGGTVSTTATALVALLNASTIPEFAKITWTANASAGAVTGTRDTEAFGDDDEPFTATSGVSGGTGTFDAFSTTTTSAGPHHWDTAGNWSLGAVPVDADDVYIERTDVDIKYGISQASIELTSLNVPASYTGRIGLPDINEDDPSNPYREYLTKALNIDPGICNIGLGDGDGSPHIRILTDSAVATFNVYSTGVADFGDPPALQITTGAANNVLNLISGDAGIALEGGSTAQFTTINLGPPDGSSSPRLQIGSGATITTGNVYGGTLETLSSLTTLNQYGGTFEFLGSAVATTVNGYAGTLLWNSTGTIGTATVGSSFVLNCEGDPRAKTITNEVPIYKGGSLLAGGGNLTLTAGWQTMFCQLSDVTLRLGFNKDYDIT